MPLSLTCTALLSASILGGFCLKFFMNLHSMAQHSR
jgi:hypothetical protein